MLIGLDEEQEVGVTHLDLAAVSRVLAIDASCILYDRHFLAANTTDELPIYNHLTLSQELVTSFSCANTCNKGDYTNTRRNQETG